MGALLENATDKDKINNKLIDKKVTDNKNKDGAKDKDKELAIEKKIDKDKKK